MEKPLHIGWLIWGDDEGGVGTAVLNNAALLASLGQTVSMWSFGPGAVAEAAARRGWTVHRLGEDPDLHRRYASHGFSPRGLLRRAAVALRLRGVLRQGLRQHHQPDVLCAPWPDLMPLAGPVAQALRLPLVLEMPATPSQYRFDLNQRVYAWMVRRWRVRTLANSDYTASRMRRVPDVWVVTPAVDAPRFDPARVSPIPRAALGVPPDAVLVGLVARLSPEKGADLAIEALSLLPAEAPALHLLLVGGPQDSAYAKGLREQARVAGVAERVHWVETVADPERYWAACDLALNARRDVEPFGLSLIEAMLMQRPAIAHALGQPAASVVDGRTGWLFHQPTAAALAEALRRALAVRGQWPAMGQAAREDVLRRFASTAHATRYLALLREHVDRLAA